jgi:hypothetical protein
MRDGNSEKGMGLLTRNTNTTPVVFAQECASGRKESSWEKNRTLRSAQSPGNKGVGFALKNPFLTDGHPKACPGDLG